MTTTLSNGTLTITYTGTQVKLSRILLAASEGLYHAYPVTVEEKIVPFAELTNAQKLKVIDQHIKRVIMDAAQDFAVNTAMNTARTDAQKEDLTL